MCVAWIGYEIERGHHSLPSKGAKDGPTPPYPTPRPGGRGPHRSLLPRGRRLRVAQPPWRSTLRIHKATTLRLGSHHPGTLPAAAGRRERTLLLARCRERGSSLSCSLG